MLNCVEKPQGKQFKEWKIRHKEFILENVQVGKNDRILNFSNNAKLFWSECFFSFGKNLDTKTYIHCFLKVLFLFYFSSDERVYKSPVFFPDMKGCVHALLQTFHVNFTALGIRSSVFRSNRTFFVIERSIRS